MIQEIPSDSEWLEDEDLNADLYSDTEDRDHSIFDNHSVLRDSFR